ncbi:MAG TPA: histidine kinase [Clostridiales bacterium]|nr:histidine kinase [Clostridiales bacterium]
MKIETFKRKILGVLFRILFPIILLLLFYNFYSIHIYNDKIEQSNRTRLIIYQNQIQKKIKNVETFVAEIVANNYSFQQLVNTENSLDAYTGAWEVMQSLKSNLAMQEEVGGYVLYNKDKKVEQAVFIKGFTYDTQLKIRKYVTSSLEKSEGLSKEWHILDVGSKPVLYRILGRNETYIISFIDMEKCSLAMEKGNDVSRITFCTSLNQAIVEKDYINKNQISFDYDNDNIVFSGKPRHMVIGEKIQNTDLSLKMMISNSGYISNLNHVQLILMIVSLLTILIIPISIWWIEKYITSPLKKLMDTMERIKEGHTEEKMEDDFGIIEYRRVSDTFNTMIYEIKKFKIEAYENEIEKKRAQLQYLQLQIRPHFFLNCLKIIYARVECQKYQQIQEMILAISQHIRYNFKDNLSLVPLQLELEHIKNYIRIQQLSTSYTIEYDISIASKFYEFKIPTLTLETFVENSFKYGMKPGVGLMLKIEATETKGKLHIRIEDNGTGFPEDMLNIINGDMENIYSDQYVGIANVKKRIKLIYGEKASIYFYNSNHGAAVEIVFQITEGEEGDQG